MLQNPKCNYVSNLELSEWKVISVKNSITFYMTFGFFLPLLIPASADAHTSMTSSLF